MYYWVYKVKCKHVKSLVSWDTIINYNNYLDQECCQWLLLVGFDANDQSVFI